MIRVILTKHDYRYEVFQIVSQYVGKTEIVFVDTTTDTVESCHLLSMKPMVKTTGIKAEEALDVGCNTLEQDKQFIGSSDLVILESGYDELDSSVYCKIPQTEGKEIAYRVGVSSFGDKQFKNAIKATVLQCMSDLTGMEMPWGILVGIRPTKLIHEARKHEKSDGDMLATLSKEYMASDEKISLMFEVADREAPFIHSDKKTIGLYIGIPFCPTRCSYCSFTSNPIRGNERIAAEYIEALIREMNKMLEYMNSKGMKVDTLYFGGGTPTALTALQLDRILGALSGKLDLRGLREFTIEAGRADSIDRDKLTVIREAGCRRISINPQTMNDLTLHRIGRTHTAADVIDKFQLAREIGFDSINMDMIIGLPGEGIEEVRHTAKQLRELSPENITIHTMAVKRASVLNEQEYRDNGTNVVAMFREAEQQFRALGLAPYYMYRQKNMVSPLENVGYCKPGHECIYNIQMIAESVSILAMGADAVTKVIFPEENRIERAANVKDVREYIARVDEMVMRKITLFETGRPLTTK